MIVKCIENNRISSLTELQTQDDMDTIPALGPEGSHLTRTHISVSDCTGLPVISLSSIPSPVVSHWIESIRNTITLPVSKVPNVLKKAATIFESDKTVGSSAYDFEHRLSVLTGTPITIIRKCNKLITETLRHALPLSRLPTPASCLFQPSKGKLRTGAVWCRVGEIFAVNAAGNSPGVHAMWLEALALGYKVVVRPSNRDPLTPHRLITALHLAGVPSNQVIMIPCDYSTAELIIERSDLALVYGGQDVVNRFQNRKNVRVQGPGRSKLIVAAKADEKVGLKIAVEGALYHAGTACTSTTGILVEKDHHGFAKRLSETLRQIPSMKPTHSKAQLPCMPKEKAGQLVHTVLSLVPQKAILLKPEPIDISIGNSRTTVITPAVMKLSSCEDPLLARELPFPCIWVAPFEREKVNVLSDSLVVSIVTHESELFNKVLHNTNVSNVYQNKPTSWTQSGVPHDSFLGEFLMRSKGVAYEE